ncbi:HAD-like domain-containing protein [Radiomyces spectabilis]|uniref:HAD-like domain-containing protein n=1 Tax=Radiomyces spectabilis TaxID=64574 RepID=UPI0022209224|nr:HAD-like domain-containing protein [Radiomyces spectabilis]KAI8388885.1 HAD-like domain-containing protein [Radiomyces spectabilis]
MVLLARSLLARSYGLPTLVTRGIATTSKSRKYAFAFDIDGVLIKGSKKIHEAQQALKLLNGDNAANRRVPFVLLTNGGGVTEAEKAEQISQLLDIEILPEQVIVSHSPMQALAKEYENKRVLIVGGKGRKCYEVAKGYGFKYVVTPDDVHNWQMSSWPYSLPNPSALTESAINDFSKTPIHAVMMFHDSRDWGRDMQIMIDALLAKDGVLGTLKTDFSVQDVPLYFSNNDLIWSNDFPTPRLGQGSFKTSLESVYHAYTGHKLKSVSYGKPHAATYKFAEDVLMGLLPRFTGEKTRKDLHVYAVGDNPAADIKGANAYGWSSILVRTGVFQGTGNSAAYPATKVCNHVQDAVEWAIMQEESRKD